MADTARTPSELSDLFAKYLGAGDLDSLASLYEEGATLVPQPGQVVSGIAAIREALSGFLAASPTITFGEPVVVEHGELALVHANFALKGGDGAVLMTGLTSEVVRRQADGSWRYLIDDPYSIAPAVTG